MIEIVQLLLLGAVVWFVITALLAPLEALGWWAGWFGQDILESATRDKLLAEAAATDQPEAAHYIVYLSGIGALTGSSIPMQEKPFQDELEKRIPGTKVIRDVFPYSVTNMGLTSERFFSWLWRRIEAMRPKNPNAWMLRLVVFRNLFQVAVSADSRYGPIYNLGVAKEILLGLIRQGYRLGSRKPVVLVGTSGGGQIAVGAVTYLTRIINAPILVISIGGVISADPGLLRVDHLYHLYGTKDHIQTLGYRMFPDRWRWPLSYNSPWFRAERQGKITLIELGPLAHTGADSAFDPNAHFPDGQSYRDKALTTITTLVNDWFAKVQAK